MKINLDNKMVRFLVQEYVNQICNYSTDNDLNYNTYKLIHTFQVVEMAQILIDKTRPALSEKMKKHILDAALLHDLGRCHEFKNGKRLKVDHGKIGARLIRKNFPQMKTEALATLFHNKLPSRKDPQSCQPVLDYVRDADMLANLKYQSNDANMWLVRILDSEDKSFLTPVIDKEIFNAVKENRPVKCNKIKIRNLLTMWLWELCWFFNLRTTVGINYAKKEKIFIKFKKVIMKKIVPLTTLKPRKQKELTQQIQTAFPDSLFLK